MNPKPVFHARSSRAASTPARLCSARMPPPTSISICRKASPIARSARVMCVPLMSRATGKAFGVVQVHTHNRCIKFTPDDLKLLVSVAGQAAVALENARLHESLVARAGLERELKLAQQVQRSFLPKAFPQKPDYEFWAHYEVGVRGRRRLLRLHPACRETVSA